MDSIWIILLVISVIVNVLQSLVFGPTIRFWKGETEQWQKHFWDMHRNWARSNDQVQRLKSVSVDGGEELAPFDEWVEKHLGDE